jgi:hypothetical protein
VKYRAHLYAWQYGRWTKVLSSPFYWQQVGGGKPESGAWWDESTRRWVRGDHRFNILRLTGTAYRVSVENVWLPFYGSVGSAYSPEQWVPHIDDRKGAYYLSQVDYCV